MSTTLRTGLLAATLAVLMGSTAANAKPLVYCSEGSPENFTPALNTTGTSLDAARPAFNQLVEFERGTTNVVPGLAEKWDVSADGLEITFHLRKGVKVHSRGDFKPSRDFNADDVLFSFNRQWKEDHPYHKVSGGAYDYFNDMDMPKLLKSLDKVDDYTVKMTLTEANAPILANLAMDFGTIASAEYADHLMKAGTPEKFDQEPVGTGPFEFVGYQKDAVIRYKAFADYWGGKAKLDGLIFSITPDATARFAKLQKNECQVMFGPNPADLAAMKEDANITLNSQPGLNIAYWAFNVTKPPFDKKEVRQAFTMAIDKDAIIKDVYQGAGQAAKNLIPPTIWGYNDKIVDYKYDPEKAKEMLQDGRRYGAARDRPLVHARAAALQSERQAHCRDDAGGPFQGRRQRQARDLRVGRVQEASSGRRASDRAARLDRRQWRPRQFLFPARLLGGARPGGQNLSKWCDKYFDEKLIKARTLSDKAERTKLYEEMQVIAHEEAPQMTMAHSIVYEPTRKEVTDYKVSPLGRHDFYGVGLN